jgi:hypothetical protein
MVMIISQSCNDFLRWVLDTEHCVRLTQGFRGAQL